MPWRHQARLAGDAVLDAAHRTVDRHPVLRRWQRLRLFRRAGLYGPAIAYDTGRGVRYFVRPDDQVIGRAIIRDGGFDLHKIDAALELLRSHDFAIEQLLDIGANIGTTTVEILHRLPDAIAVALEPEPRNFDLLRHNILANDLTDRASAYRLAASDRPATLRFELSNDNPGDHRVTDRAIPGSYGEEEWKSISVSAARLDDLVGDGRIDVSRSTLLSLDVQGHEGHVLDGARRLLAARPALLVEFWPYGLDRAQGRDRVIAHLRSYPQLFDVTTGAAREIDAADLSGLTASIGAIDLLALPPLGGACQ